MSSSITDEVKPVGEQTSKKRPKSPPNDSIYCVDIKSATSGEWVRIEATYQETDLIILKYIDTLVSDNDTFDGKSVRYYTLDESAEYAITTADETCVTPEEKEAILAAKESVLGIHPADVRIECCG